MQSILFPRFARPTAIVVTRLVVAGLVIAVTLGWNLPHATAQITSVSPGSARVLPGNSVGVNVTTDLADTNVNLVGGQHLPQQQHHAKHPLTH